MSDFRSITTEKARAEGYRSFDAVRHGQTKNAAKLNADGLKLANHCGWRIMAVTDAKEGNNKWRRTFWCMETGGQINGLR